MNRSLRLAFLIFSIPVISTFRLLAQPVLTYADFAPQAGDQYTVRNGLYTWPGNSGANQTWNFSLANISTATTYSVNPIGAIPCGNQYPNANVGIGTGSYDMFQVTSTEDNYYGDAMTPGSADFIFSDPEKRYMYPMNYTDNFSDAFLGVSNLSPTPRYRTGSNTITYDGYGTIITPLATYNNAIRIHRQISWIDSLQSIDSCTGDYYYWFAPGNRYPVAQIWLVTCTAGGSTGAMFLQSITIGVKENELSPMSLSASPNPFSSSFNLRSSEVCVGEILSVTDVSGRVVRTFIISSAEMSVDLGDLENGVYILIVNGSRGLRIVKSDIE